MNRPYALKRLLEHGELSYQEMREITGWSADELRKAFDQLRHDELICKVNDKWGLDLGGQSTARKSRGTRTGSRVLVSRQKEWTRRSKAVPGKPNPVLDQVLRQWI